jgi:hypothetical protein
MFLTLALVLAADPQYVVENKCPQYVVVNKCPAPVAAPAKTGYPVHAGIKWTGPDGRIGSASASHLSNHPNHANKFPADWLKTLTHAEIQSLHDDDHDGRVKWEYVPGRAPAKTIPANPVVPGVKAPYTSDPYCPPGASH